ncbi:MAG: hypothetical protein J5X22_05145 [Candidatus Accumulibacter sp.]|uniref:Uncharacterized protein n=1 Tax=Candidatus Accumulibacter cognatus TaxID=2954383 RepID=A0A7D5SCK6_9PROT|nr:hypothetical protein [Accumulibacter sp.]MBO3709918.1 hypothetical protein [Accumulibacter sp.]QLH50297.1 MAG: hypothetical protein HWD57_11255 [Candidatus Accumulibacter cognatus]
MGGYGSGRQWGKATTSDMRTLDIRRLQRDGLLTPGLAFGWQWTRHGVEVASIQMRMEVDRVILNYRSRCDGGEWQPIEYPVHLEWTPCHLGGRRAWFLCPARGCRRRVAILFGGSIFACRHCHRLAYPCQRETNDDRAMRRADTIRRRLGWEPGILNGEGGKPKGMHWRTFNRLTAEYLGFAEASLAGAMKRFASIDWRLAGMDDVLNREG